jgi:hypothetical protein
VSNMPGEGIIETDDDHWLVAWITCKAFKPEF